MTTNTNDLTGRALDEAAARAMGWKKPSEMGRCDDCGWPLRIGDGAGCFADRCCMYWPDGRPIRADTPPQFTEREMLAWLHGRGIVHTASSSKVCEVRYMSFRKMQFVPSGADETVPEWLTGADLREALARLVVAVAAREATDGK